MAKKASKRRRRARKPVSFPAGERTVYRMSVEVEVRMDRQPVVIEEFPCGLGDVRDRELRDLLASRLAGGLIDEWSWDVVGATFEGQPL